MDNDRLEGGWQQLRGRIKARWGRITDDDLDVIDGNRERLEGIIRERYGRSKRAARKAVDEARRHWR